MFVELNCIKFNGYLLSTLCVPDTVWGAKGETKSTRAATAVEKHMGSQEAGAYGSERMHALPPLGPPWVHGPSPPHPLMTPSACLTWD